MHFKHECQLKSRPRWNDLAQSWYGPLFPVTSIMTDIGFQEHAVWKLHSHRVFSFWTSLDTAMKKQKEGGVVDARLNVFGNCRIPVAVKSILIYDHILGTENLKVADLSICPVSACVLTFKSYASIFFRITWAPTHTPLLYWLVKRQPHCCARISVRLRLSLYYQHDS